MKPPTLSMKMRVLLAVVAIVLIHLGFKMVPRWRAMRPRIYEDAYAEAMAVLREEVGGEAVDKGIFTIPKVPISLPPNAAVTSGRYSAQLFVTSDGHVVHGYECRIIPSHPHPRALLATALYLAMVEAKDTPPPEIMVSPSLSEERPALYDLDRRKRSSEEEESEDRDTLGGCVAASALGRFLGRLRKDTASSAIPDADHERLVTFATEQLRRVLPPRNQGASSLVEGLVGVLRGRHDRRSIPVLKKIVRLEKSSELVDALKGIPIIGRMFDTMGDYDLPSVEGIIENIEAFAGKSSEECFKIAVEGTFGTPEDRAAGTSAPQRHLCYLAKTWPAEFSRLVCEHFPTLDDSERDRFYSCALACGEDNDALIRLAAEDEFPGVFVEANRRLYESTGDAAFITAIVKRLEEVDPLKAQNDYAVRRARDELMDIYEEHPELTEIYESLIPPLDGLTDDELLGPEIAGVEVGLLAVALVTLGGPENAETVMLLVNAYDERERARKQKGDETPIPNASNLSSGLGGIPWSRYDSHLVSLLLEYLESHAPSLECYGSDTFIQRLAEKGDARLIPLLEAALIEVRREVESEKAKTGEQKETWSYLYYGYKTKTPLERREELLRDSLVTLRLHVAGDAVAFLAGLSGEDLGRISYNKAPGRLAEDLDEAALLSMLADESLGAAMRALTYAALCQRRMADAEESE